MHFDGKYSFEAEVVDKAEKQLSWFKISNFLKKIRNASRQQSEEYNFRHFELLSMENGYEIVLGSGKDFFLPLLMSSACTKHMALDGMQDGYNSVCTAYRYCIYCA